MSGRGVERVLDMIEWFSAEPGAVGLARISASLNLPKSSALLMLRTLQERGYISRNDAGDYRLERLPGGNVANRGALLALAAPFITDAVVRTQESGFLAVLDDDEIRYLNKVLPEREILYDRNMSMTRAAHKVASGIVILAWSGAAAVEEYIGRNVLNVAGADALRSAVQQAREQGVYLNMSGVVEGASGASAPVLDGAGRPVGAINIAGPRDRMAAQSDLICTVVAETANAVSQQLAQRESRFSKGG